MLTLIGVSIFVILSHDAAAVINGKIASPEQFKYQALLKIKTRNFEDICGGAIISEQHILTAWHCVSNAKPENIEIVVGALKFDADPYGESYKVDKIRLHDKRAYKKGHLRRYDIAVLVTTESIVYGDYVAAVDLPENEIQPGALCIFAGWGTSETSARYHSPVLKYGYGRIWSRKACKAFIGKLQDYEFCFRHSDRDPITIHDGDSGSPLVCNGVLTGVIIRGGGFSFQLITAIDAYVLRKFIEQDDVATCS